MVPGFPAVSSDLYLRDLETGANELVSLDAAGTAGGNSTLNSGSFTPDGRSIVFGSSSSTLDGRPVVGGFSSLFVARLTPFAVADLGVTAAMAETPPAGQAWAIELTASADGPEGAGAVDSLLPRVVHRDHRITARAPCAQRPRRYDRARWPDRAAGASARSW